MSLTQLNTGIASTSITWQSVDPVALSPVTEEDLPAQDTIPTTVGDPLLRWVDDDMEGIAMRAAQAAQPTAADTAVPLMVGVPISEWPRPALMQGPIDQELAASEQVVAGGAGSVLTAHPFGWTSADDLTLPGLWHIIHSAWNGASADHWWSTEEDALVPTDSTPMVQLDGTNAPMGVDAAIDRMADWERFDEPALPDRRSVTDVVRAWLSGDRAALSMLLRADAEVLARRGRRLMSVNWPLTGTGIGLALLGIIFLSGMPDMGSKPPPNQTLRSGGRCSLFALVPAASGAQGQEAGPQHALPLGLALLRGPVPPGRRAHS